jgi:hypothetical protein
MIKNTQFRIGNYLLFDDEIQFISSIHYDNTIRLKKTENDECHGCYKINNTRIKPIPLTEEIIKRFGYFKQQCFYKNGSNIEFYINNDRIICKLFGENLYNIYFVHQFQNLFYSITSIDLKINE